MNEITFSIIVPIYNVEKYLEKCIESVLYQNYRSWELILIDDGSTDQSGEICDKYATIDSRVKVIHKKNAGPPAARNTGIYAACGKYILHLDGDDFYVKDCLDRLGKIVETQKDLYLGNGRIDYWSEESYREVSFREELIIQSKKEDILSMFFGGGSIPAAAWHNIYKTEYVKNRLLFDENLTWSEDFDYFMKCLFHTSQIEMFDYNFYNYRHNNDGAMTKNYSKKNVMSNVSVIVCWYQKIDEIKLEEELTHIIKCYLSRNMIYAITFVSRMKSGKDRRQFAKLLKRHKDIMKTADDRKSKIIYYIYMLLGGNVTSNLINTISKITN